MARIVYLLFSAGGISGGHKMILRHVEALRELGFDAIARTGSNNAVPSWFDFRAPVEIGTAFGDDDVIVCPNDALRVLRQMAGVPQKKVVFAQSLYDMAAEAFPVLDRYPPDGLPVFMTVGPGLARVLSRAFPAARVELAPGFADERVFRPAASRQEAIAYIPGKRVLESGAIQAFFQRFHPEWRELPWRPIQALREPETAAVMGSSSLFLSLGRLEGLGLTALEAMAAGGLPVGFTGVGGRDYATPDNGFWVEEDDCQAAAEALAEAAAVVREGGPKLARRLEAARETARRWSYAACKARLEEIWMRLAPEARVRDGPLD